MPGSSGSVTPVPVSPALRTLGGAALLDAATGTTLLGPGKPLALVAYLAFNPGHTATREFLIDLLWADLELARARHALRQAVWALRHILGEEALAGREELRLTVPVRSDRDDFLTAMERGDYDKAVERYQGPFLPDLAIPGGVEFEQWADLERGQLRATFLRACETATRRKLAASQFREAQRIARRARDADPGNELGWRLLLESLAAGQDFITATLEADALEARATGEQRQLEPATRAMIHLARQAPDRARTSDHQELVADLVGREKEFSVVTEAWDRAAHGPATHVHLTAPAGLGKTRLLQDLEARLTATGGNVVAIRAHPGERQIPYALVGELARGVSELPGAIGVSPGSAGALVALNPVLSSRLSVPADVSNGEDALRRRAVALTEAIAAAAEEAPFALLIDDLHWADPLSRQLLEGVLSRLDGARVAVVTASRPVREPPPQTEKTRTLTLPPLDESQVASFVTSLGALPSDEPWARGIERGLHLATSGSPLLLLQLLKLALERGTLTLDEAGWRCADPEALRRMLREGEAMRHRLDALPREQRWLVTTLAVAGIPLSLPVLAAASGREDVTTGSDLETLERLGLVQQGDGAWDLAHDEIGTAACAGQSDTAERSAHRGIGAALATAAGEDPALLVRAARHLVAAGDLQALGEVFRHYTGSLRARGDGRSPTALLHDLLGGAVAADVRRAMLGTLPVTWRLGLWSTRRRVGAATAVVLLSLVVAARVLAPAPPGPVADLIIFAREDSALVTWRVGVDPNNWNPREDLRPLREATEGNAIPRDATYISYSPDGTRLVFDQRTGDITTDDLMLMEQGRIRRLTDMPRDDLAATWSPDGRLIAFLTARWSPEGADDYDLAVLDPATGNVRRLTHTADWDLPGAWAPDGSRIAFGRHVRASGAHLVCTITVDGLDEACREIPGYDVMYVLGWVDANTLALEADAEERVVLIYDLATGAVSTVNTHVVQEASVSPDGAWLACLCSRTAEEETGLWVIPIDRGTVGTTSLPRGARRVAMASAARFTWRMRAAPPALDRLELPDSVMLTRDGTAKPAVVALDGEGRRYPLAANILRWSIADSTIAAVDRVTGLITPKRTGTTTVWVTAGGWREDSTRVRVVPGLARTVLVDSTWEDLDTLPTTARPWRLYGRPLPRRVDSTDGPAISNNGEGVYSSGIYSTASYSARDGFGVEIEVSVPLTRFQWQIQSLFLNSDRVSRLDGWDWRSGGLPAGSDPEESCSGSYPRGDGKNARDFFNFAVGPNQRGVRTDRFYGDGRWFRLRLQIFTDGTCGAAVDGRPVWHSVGRLPLDRRYFVQLGGNSAGTTIRVRKVEVWEGVKGGVDWAGRGG